MAKDSQAKQSWKELAKTWESLADKAERSAHDAQWQTTGVATVVQIDNARPELRMRKNRPEFGNRRGE